MRDVCISVKLVKMGLIAVDVQLRGIVMGLGYVCVLIIPYMMIKVLWSVKVVLELNSVIYVVGLVYVRLVILIIILH